MVYRLEEAGRTLIALPGAGGFPRGYGSGWPEVVRAGAEAYGYEVEHVRASPPSARAITRMDEAFSWLRHIPGDRASVRRIVLMRALVSPVTERNRWSYRRIGRAFGWDDRAVKRWHQQGVDMIVKGLRRERTIMSLSDYKSAHPSIPCCSGAGIAARNRHDRAGTRPLDASQKIRSD